MCIEDDILTTTNGYKCNSKKDCYLREISVSTLMIYPAKLTSKIILSFTKDEFNKKINMQCESRVCVSKESNMLMKTYDGVDGVELEDIWIVR